MDEITINAIMNYFLANIERRFMY